MSADGGPLLLEQRSGAFVRRLAPDGTYSEYADVETSLVDGRIEQHAVPAAWRVQERLTPGQLAPVETAVREHFFDLDAEYRPSGQVSDGFRVTWRACLDGQDHTVALTAVDAASVPGLDAVSAAFELALARAAAGE
ncbi:MAG: hypothetical protein JWM64_1738 [Frankiales bacterium]|nr:hypothetical protein [Frankiales bacterium]